MNSLENLIKDILNYSNNSNITPSDFSDIFLLSFYCSNNIVEGIYLRILTEKLQYLTQIYTNVSESDLRSDLVFMFSDMMNSHRDMLFKLIVIDSRKIIRLYSNNPNWLEDINRFNREIENSIYSSLVGPAENVGNLSIESIYSIITQAVLDSHRKSGSKNSPSSSVTSIIEGRPPKDKLFKLFMKKYDSPNVISKYIAENIYNIKFSDIILDTDILTYNDLKDIDLFKLISDSSFEIYDYLQIILNLDVMAIFSLNIGRILNMIEEFFSKFFKNVQGVYVIGSNSSNYKDRNISVIVILNIEEVTKQTLEKILKKISRESEYKKIKKNIEKDIQNLINVTILTPNKIDAEEKLGYVRESEVSIIDNLKEREETSETIIDTYNRDNKVLTRYIFNFCVEELNEINISGIENSEIPDYIISRLSEYFGDKYKISENIYIMPRIDHIVLKLSGFNNIENVHISDYFSIYKVSSSLITIELDNMNNILEYVEIYLDEIRELSEFPSNIYIYDNNVLFYPFIESKYITYFKQSLINDRNTVIYINNIVEMKFIIDNFILHINNNIEEIFKESSLIKDILEIYSKQDISILSSMFESFDTININYNKEVNPNTFLIINDLSSNYINEYISQYSESTDININDLFDYISEQIYNYINENKREIVLKYYNTIFPTVRKIHNRNINKFMKMYPQTEEYKSILDKYDWYSNELFNSIISAIPSEINKLNNITITEMYFRLVNRNIEEILSVSREDIKLILMKNSNITVMNNLKLEISNRQSSEDTYISLSDLKSVFDIDRDLVEETFSLYYENYVKVDSDVIRFISENNRMKLSDRNLEMILLNQDYTIYPITVYNGEIRDYMKLEDVNGSNIFHQDILYISEMEGTLNACNAYYIIVYNMLHSGELNIHGSHIDLRADMLCRTGKFRPISISSVNVKPDPTIAGRVDPASNLRNIALKNLKVETTDVGVGSGYMPGVDSTYRAYIDEDGEIKYNMSSGSCIYNKYPGEDPDVAMDDYHRIQLFFGAINPEPDNNTLGINEVSYFEEISDSDISPELEEYSVGEMSEEYYDSLQSESSNYDYYSNDLSEFGDEY